MRPILLASALLAVAALAPRPAHAAWPSAGVPIANTVSWYNEVRFDSDGPGRIVVYAFGHRNTYAYRLARRVGLDATPGTGFATGEMYVPFADGAEGWFAYYPISMTPGMATIMHQVGGEWDPAWPLYAGNVSGHPVVVSDSAGGAYAASPDTLARLQRFGPDGQAAPGWSASGVALTTGVPQWGIRTFIKLVVDPQHRAIVLALDANNALRTFRVLPDGTLDPVWAGAPLASFPVNNVQPIATTLAIEGDHFWVTWNSAGLHAARLDVDGALQPGWPVLALPVGGDESDFGETRAFPDGAGGLYAFSLDWTQSGHVATPLYGTHLDASGTVVTGWSAPGSEIEAPAGTPISSATFVAAADGTGGVFLGWGAKLTHLGADHSLVAGWSPAGDVLSLPGIVANGACGSGGLSYSGPLAVYGDGSGFPLVATTVSDNCTWPYAALKLARFVPASFLGVTPPAPRGLALQLLGPNPAAGTRRFALSIARDAPATLEVCDVAGRVVGRAFVEPGAAARELAWTPAGGARAGVYFARLTQRGTVATARFVVLD